MKNAGALQFNDRQLAGEVRSMTLQECKKHLQAKKGKYYSMVLNNLSRNVLPRLSELTGDEGRAIIVELSEVIAKKNALTSSTNGNS